MKENRKCFGTLLFYASFFYQRCLMLDKWILGAEPLKDHRREVCICLAAELKYQQTFPRIDDLAL